MPSKNGQRRLFAISIAAVVATILALLSGQAGAQDSPPYDPPPDIIAPIVTISGAPKSLVKTHRHRRLAHFKFESDDPDATFTCRIDNGHFLPCASPMAVSFRAGKGKGRRHVFLVRARDLAGNSSGTAIRSFRLLHTHRPSD